MTMLLLPSYGGRVALKKESPSLLDLIEAANDDDDGLTHSTKEPWFLSCHGEHSEGI